MDKRTEWTKQLTGQRLILSAAHDSNWLNKVTEPIWTKWTIGHIDKWTHGPFKWTKCTNRHLSKWNIDKN